MRRRFPSAHFCTNQLRLGFNQSPMTVQTTSSLLEVPAAGTDARGPTAALDGLLAAMGPREGEAIDLALDLRFAYRQRHDAAACVELAFRLRRALGDRHYLEFYRVRSWLSRVLSVEMRCPRAADLMRFPMPLLAGEPITLEKACLRRWAGERPGSAPHLAQIRLVFASPRTGTDRAEAALGQPASAFPGET